MMCEAGKGYTNTDKADVTNPDTNTTKPTPKVTINSMDEGGVSINVSGDFKGEVNIGYQKSSNSEPLF
jgi:hypothetical protein